MGGIGLFGSRPGDNDTLTRRALNLVERLRRRFDEHLEATDPHAGYVLASGDTMTGQLEIDTGSGSTVRVTGTDGVAQVILDSGGTTGVMDARVLAQDDGVNRWILVLYDQTDGSVKLQRYNASGVYQDDPLEITSAGAVLSNGSQVPVIRYGAVTGVPAGGSAAVSFGHTFSSAPRVQTTTVTSANANSTAAGVTTTGCTVYNHDVATRSIAWLAIGPP